MSDTEAESPPTFTAVETRVLGCLMEKELATPDNYPLTLNSLTLACNQKSNRDPVMNLSQGEVGHTVNELADRQLVHIEYGERAQRIAHRMRGDLGIDRRQQALLSMLMLRRPQTLSDLRARTQRLADFSDLDDLRQELHTLIERSPALVVCLARDQGQREDRYAQTLSGEVDTSSARTVAAVGDGQAPGRPAAKPGREDRLEALEQRVARLEQLLGAEE